MITNLISKIAISTILPKFLEDTYEYLFGDEKEEPVKKKYSKRTKPEYKSRKKYDGTKITKADFDTIKKMHKKWKATKSTNRITSELLVQDINRDLGLNKSCSFYAKIWNNKIKRSTLLDERD